MRFFLAIAIIVILVGLLFISVDSIVDYGVSSLVLAGISSFALFRIFKFLLEGYKLTGNSSAEARNSAKVPSPFDYIIFGDVSDEIETGEWKE